MKGIKEVRKSANITQEELSYLMDVSLSTVRRWDKKIDNCPCSKFVLLCDILHYSSIDDLMEELQ